MCLVVCFPFHGGAQNQSHKMTAQALSHDFLALHLPFWCWLNMYMCTIIILNCEAATVRGSIKNDVRILPLKEFPPAKVHTMTYSTIFIENLHVTLYN